MMDGQQFVPMSATRIIDRVFYFYSKNFIKFFLLMALVYVPLGVLTILLELVSQSLVEPVGFEVGTGIAAILLGITVLVVSIIAGYLAPGVLAQAFSQLYLGKALETGNLFRAVLPKLGSMIGAGIVSGLFVLFGYLLFFVPGVIFQLWYCLITVVIVLENQRAMNSLGRSKDLIKGNLGKVFVTLFLAIIIALVIKLSLVGVYGAISSFANPGEFGQPSSMLWRIIEGAVDIVASIITAPITAGAIVLLYYDLRIRKEGFDLEMLAQSMAVQGDGYSNEEITDFTK